MSKRHGAVAAGHDLVAEAAVEVLAAGGNAYDAALAGMAVACVCEPVLASFGGGGFLLAVPAGGRSRVYDFFVQTPGRLPAAPGELDFRPVDVHFGSEIQEFHIGWGSTAVPGLPAGYFAIHRDLARMPVAELLAPAIRHAGEGVRINPVQAGYLELVSPLLLATEPSRALYGSSRLPGSILQEGEPHRQPELADALDALAHEGPDLFYRGEMAAALLDAAGSAGVLAAADFEAYETVIREPLEVPFGGAVVEGNPPPASGGLLVAFGLALLEGSGIGDLPPTGDAHASLLAAVLGSTGAARVAAAAVDGGDGTGRMLSPEFLQTWREQVAPLTPARSGTTQITVADADGNVAALSISNGSGSGCVIPGTGIAVNNMLGEADLNPDGFHRWPPSRRLTSMMAPSAVRWPDGRIAATGSGGSNRIRSAVLQVLVNLVAHGMDAARAVETPRLHVEGDRLSVEYGFDPESLAGTLERWPDHRVWRQPSMFFGGTHTVVVGGGTVEAYGDPRRGGVCRLH